MIKLAILSLLVLGCVHDVPVAAPAPTPNRVCEMIALHNPEAKCENRSPGHERDVARLEIDSGVKYCWETFDEKSPIACATIVLSKAEAAANAASAAVERERDRAKLEAAKADADKTKGAPIQPATAPSKAKP